MRASAFCDALVLPGGIPLDVSLVVGDVEDDGLGGAALEGGIAVDVPDDGVDELLVDGGVVDCASVVEGGIAALDTLVPEVDAAVLEVVAQAVPATAKIEAASAVANFRWREFIGVPFVGTGGIAPGR